jgi:hypothetical protein
MLSKIMLNVVTFWLFMELFLFNDNPSPCLMEEYLSTWKLLSGSSWKYWKLMKHDWCFCQLFFHCFCYFQLPLQYYHHFKQHIRSYLVLFLTTRRRKHHIQKNAIMFDPLSSLKFNTTFKLQLSKFPFYFEDFPPQWCPFYYSSVQCCTLCLQHCTNVFFGSFKYLSVVSTFICIHFNILFSTLILNTLKCILQNHWLVLQQPLCWSQARSLHSFTAPFYTLLLHFTVLYCTFSSDNPSLFYYTLYCWNLCFFYFTTLLFFTAPFYWIYYTSLHRSDVLQFTALFNCTLHNIDFQQFDHNLTTTYPKLLFLMWSNHGNGRTFLYHQNNCQCTILHLTTSNCTLLHLTAPHCTLLHF